jgi:hypothetical protein
MERSPWKVDNGSAHEEVLPFVETEWSLPLPTTGHYSEPDDSKEYYLPGYNSM